MKLSTFIAAGAFIFLSAFVMKKNSPDQNLYGTKWTLKKIYTDSATEEMPFKAFIKFNSEKKSAGGNGGCNVFGSTLTVNGDKMTITQIFSTKMFCEGVQQYEDAYLKQLQNVTRFEIVDKTLILYHGKDKVLEFEGE